MISYKKTDLRRIVSMRTVSTLPRLIHTWQGTADSVKGHMKIESTWVSLFKGASLFFVLKAVQMRPAIAKKNHSTGSKNFCTNIRR